MSIKNMLNEKKKKQKKAVCNGITYTTGDPALNIKHFNKRMGTDFENSNQELIFDTSDLSGAGAESAEVVSTGETSGGLSEEMITEAKRETKRYYIRPQNIFCANKSDVLKALTEINNENCSVYTLKNLEDHDDVHLLQNSDIIYYYDNEILYDKNHVKIMDYKLSIKSEEERKKFSGSANEIPEASFRKVYDDRLTDRTLDLEESLFNINPKYKSFGFNNGNCFGIVVLPEGRFSEYNSERVANSIFNKLKDQVKAEPFNYKDNYEVKLYQVIDEDNIEYLDQFSAATLLDNLLNAKIESPYEIDFELYNNEPEIAEEENFEEITQEEDIFKQDFEARNVFGESLEKKICCICGEEYEGYGNNPEPYKEKEKGKCCDSCNIKFVIPARMEGLALENIEEK